MKQVLLRKGKINVEDAPAPALGDKQVLVEVHYSLISAGTELSTVKLSGASLLQKAQERPKEVKKVLDSIKIRGVQKTLAIVQSKLDESKALGYSCSGSVLAVGKDVTRFRPGDAVACAGAGAANHAEVVSVPENLVVPIPSGVEAKVASMVTLGAIALQGVRRADLRLGEIVAVVGLGLIGQITVQLLSAAGCQVVGMDIDPERVSLAEKNGLTLGVTSSKELENKIQFMTGGHGVDATLITASTTSDEPARTAFRLTRKKGKIVVVGAVGMNLERSPFYEKEQDFLISCSYGPGRYDPAYESEGKDYPYAYVRWTENRNMSGFLTLIKEKKINPGSLITDAFPIDQAAEAYAALQTKKGSLAAVLSYPQNGKKPLRAAIKGKALSAPSADKIRVGLLGLGNFTQSSHLPNLSLLKKEAVVTAVWGQRSASAATFGRRLNVSLQATEPADIFKSSDVDAVLISTRHDSHARLAKEALLAGKSVYLEKPLALTREEVEDLDQTLSNLKDVPTFMVGFNRRFSPAGQQVQRFLKRRQSPAFIHFRVNAGVLPNDHWTKGPEGGGRLIGEACHMIDFFKAMLGSRIEEVTGQALGGASLRGDENFSSIFKFEDGSVGALEYLSNGNAGLPKERVEIHCDGTSMVIDDFKSLIVHGDGSNWSGSQDKGHLAALKTFFDAIHKSVSFPIPWDDIRETSLAAIELNDAVLGRLPS